MIVNQPMQTGQYQGEKPSGSKGKNKKAPSYNSGKTGQAPSYNSGKTGQAPDFKREGGKPQFTPSPLTGPNGFGVDPVKPSVSQLAPVSQLPSNSYNRDPRQDRRFNALSQQDQQKYYDGGMNRDLVASLGNSQGTQPAQPTPASTAPGSEQAAPPIDWKTLQGTGVIGPGSEQVVGQDYVGDNGQTRTNMGELSNDEWLKKMNIAQPSADETSLRTDIESAAPVDGDPVESRIQDVMQRQGKTREEAEAQNASAIQQGSDFNNDGAVSNKEWSQFQSNAEQAPAEQAPQNNFGSGFQDFINQPQVQGLINQASSKKSSSPPQYGGGMMGGRQGGMMGGGSYGSYGGGYRPDRPQYQGQQYGGGGGYSTGNYGAPRGYTPQQRQSLPGNMAPEDRYPDPAMDNSGYNGYGQQYRYDPRFNVPPF
jgi:hypothetical protein